MGKNIATDDHTTKPIGRTHQRRLRDPSGVPVPMSETSATDLLRQGTQPVNKNRFVSARKKMSQAVLARTHQPGGPSG